MKRLIAFFSPAAFEQRARDRERRDLVEELERHPYVVNRLAQLEKLDSVAELDATRAAARRPVNFVFSTGDANPLRADIADRRFMVVK